MVSPKKVAQAYPSSSLHHHHHNNHHHHHHESSSNSECETAIPLGATNSPISIRGKLQMHRYVGTNTKTVPHHSPHGCSREARMSWVMRCVWMMLVVSVVGVICMSGRSGGSGPNEAVFLSQMGRVIAPVTKSDVSSVDPNASNRGVLLMARKEDGKMDRMDSLLASSPQWTVTASTEQERIDFIEHHCKDDVWKVYQQLPNNADLQLEIWKYCQMATADSTTPQAMAFLDHESPLLVSWKQLLSLPNDHQASLAVLSHQHKDLPHSSLLLLSHSHRLSVAKHLLQTISDTPLHQLNADPLILPRALSQSLQSLDNVHYLQQHCHKADSTFKYSCDIRSQRQHTLTPLLVMTTPHPMFPRLSLPPIHQYIKPYSYHYNPHLELPMHDQHTWPFIATIRESRNNNNVKNNAQTYNFYQILSEMDCLPSDQYCSACLRDQKKGASCSKCQKQCKCYCKHLCHFEVPQKRISNQIQVTPPLYRKDSSRSVPRIIHQTYYETVTPQKYPNMFRLIQSWKTAGWEYHFYTDDDIAHILHTHFPPEVKEAFDALQPGAFKADLFRYCVLLIYGGVYADMDVLLEGNLEQIISPQIGFMTPQDEPGISTGHRMCLWNGFIAAAPGHSYLAQVIETVVNNIRNRFTSVDMDQTLCPDPDLSVSHSYDLLFTAGPCILGASVNRILQNHPQQAFQPGEIKVDQQILSKHYIPDRTIILHQRKWDMGAHRFTFDEKNLLVAATDMPGYDDRKKDDDGHAHYSILHVRKQGIYGLKNLYSDRNIANEDIRIKVTPHKTIGN